MDHLCYIIVVLFHPTEQIVTRFDYLGRSYHVLLVDNTPANERQIKNSPKSAEYISLNENRGIAYAQNIGIIKALKQGAEQIIFLDQDSEVNGSFVEHMVGAMAELRQFDTKVAILGPTIVDKTTGNDYKHVAFKGEYAKVNTVISSGSIIIAEALREVGLMEERLFIDLVDHEWCWRACSKGWHVYITSKVKLLHKVGQQTITLLGVTFLACAPIRYYYKTRNALWMHRRDYIPQVWKRNSRIRIILNIFFLPFINSQHILLCYKNLFRGLKDGFLKRDKQKS